MDKLEKVNKALKHLYELVTIVGTFNQKERDLFCSYIEYLDKENECKQIIKSLEGNKQLTMCTNHKNERRWW